VCPGSSSSPEAMESLLPVIIDATRLANLTNSYQNSSSSSIESHEDDHDHDYRHDARNDFQSPVKERLRKTDKK